MLVPERRVVAGIFGTNNNQRQHGLRRKVWLSSCVAQYSIRIKGVKPTIEHVLRH